MKKETIEQKEKIKQVMHEFHAGTLKLGKRGINGKVINPKQAVAIALREAEDLKK